MRKAISLIIIWVLLCTNCSKSRQDDLTAESSNRYSVTYNGDTLTIKRKSIVSSKPTDELWRFVKRQGEYHDTMSGSLAFSVKRDVYRTTQEQTLTVYGMAEHTACYIGKVTNCPLKLTDLVALDDINDLYVTAYYASMISSKDDYRLIKVYYYDANYKIRAIVDFGAPNVYVAQ